jgi:hypothetical protein
MFIPIWLVIVILFLFVIPAETFVMLLLAAGLMIILGAVLAGFWGLCHLPADMAVAIGPLTVLVPLLIVAVASIKNRRSGRYRLLPGAHVVLTLAALFGTAGYVGASLAGVGWFWVFWGFSVVLLWIGVPKKSRPEAHFAALGHKAGKAFVAIGGAK